MKSNNSVKELNSAFQKYFRYSKRVRIHNRSGVFVVADDRIEAVDLVRKLFISRGEKEQEIISSRNVLEAQNQIENCDKGNGIKAVVIDLGLDGEGENGDGVFLAKWLNDQYPEIPFVFSTGREKRFRELEKQFPGVDIFIKGKDSLHDLAEALGLNVEDNKITESDCIPIDNVRTEEREEVGSGMFSFVRKFLTI